MFSQSLPKYYSGRNPAWLNSIKFDKNSKQTLNFDLQLDTKRSQLKTASRWLRSKDIPKESQVSDKQVQSDFVYTPRSPNIIENFNMDKSDLMNPENELRKIKMPSPKPMNDPRYKLLSKWYKVALRK